MHSISVQIIPSVALERLRLSKLSGRTATIIEPIESNNGCWARLDGEPYLDESEWYIPAESLIFKVGDRYTTSMDI